MSSQKRHTSHRSSMLHLRYLASFMDEIDREVMSLTDRAFKSLCIGDEAIYNDSEFSPSPVSCHKPQVKEVSKKTQKNSFSAIKKLDSYLLNTENSVLERSSKNSSKDTSHAMCAILHAKMNSVNTNIRKDSWDTSVLLSIQKELLEFSSDYHCLTVNQLSPVKKNLNLDEKGTDKKLSKDTLIPTEKSSKCKHNQNNKLKKLNSKNLFLHSEFSPFLSWRDLNAFSIGQDCISKITLSNRQSELYDSPLYKELTAAHEHNKLHGTPLMEKNVEKCPKEIQTYQLRTKSVKSTSLSLPPTPKKETECDQHDILAKVPLLATEQKCNLEKGQPFIPWRKNKSTEKRAIYVGHSLITVPVCKRSKAEEGCAHPNEKDVKTIKEQTSSSSTPFSILQLLTPVILSRHGTGTSEILEAALSPTALEVPPLSEREMHPSPEIKREGYKSMASSLLFNIKDNRKRVKAMYSSPRFKGLDVASQNKGLPLHEVSISKDVLEIPEISGAKTVSPAFQKVIISTMSPLLETKDTQSCSPQGFANDGVLEQYFALSLLQSDGSGNTSPSASRVANSLLQLHQKASPEENNFRANSQNVINISSQVYTDEANNTSQIKTHDTQSNPNTFLSSTKSNEQIISDSINENNDKLKTNRTVSMQKSSVKKHLFSASQNNYIKFQRFVGTDDYNDHDDGDLIADKVLLAIKDKKCTEELSRHSKNTKTKEIRQEERNAVFHQDKVIGTSLLKESVNKREENATPKQQSSMMSMSSLETHIEQEVQNETFSIKGNTSAKRALFASVEDVTNKMTTPLIMKENIVIDKYDLAKMALEEVILAREQRNIKSEVVYKYRIPIDRNKVGCKKSQDGQKIPNNGENQQTSIFMLNKSTIISTKDRKGQVNASAFKRSKQSIKMRSGDVVTKHGESYVAEVNLDRPCKQEACLGWYWDTTHDLKHTEREELCIEDQNSNTENANKGDKILELQEKVLANNIGHTKVETKRGDHLESRDIHSIVQLEEESSIEKKASSYKPEIHPKRGRWNSKSNGRVGKKTIRNKEFKIEGDISVKTEEMEGREVSKVWRSQSKNRDPERGNVLAMKEKYDKESVVHHKDVQKQQSIGGTSSEKPTKEMPNEQSPKNKIKHTFIIIPKLTIRSPEMNTFSISHKEMDLDTSRTSDNPSKTLERGEEECLQREHDDKQDLQKTISDLKNNRQEMQDCKANGTDRRHLGDNHNKSKGCGKNSVKVFFNENVGLPSLEREFTEVALPFNSIKEDESRKDNMTVHEILRQSQSLSSLKGKQILCSSLPSNRNELLLHKSECASQAYLDFLLSEAEVCNLKEKVDRKEDFLESKMDSQTFSNQEIESVESVESVVSNKVISPVGDVDKSGWVYCLNKSAQNLTQISHGHAFKDLTEMTQPLCQIETLNESKNGEENMELINDCVYSPFTMPPIPEKNPQPNQPAMHLLSLLTTQPTSVKEGKLSFGSVSVSEEEEQHSALSTLSEGVDSYETSGGDKLEQNISSSALTDAKGSKAPSERFGSVCNENETHEQNKPPAVLPKTEKALHRAMKLTTRRLQRDEAKSKFECSSDKCISHKTERRHPSTDKIENDRSQHSSVSFNTYSRKHSEHYLDDTLEPKINKSERHSKRHSSHKSQNIEDSNTSKKLQNAKYVVGHTKTADDSKSHNTKKQHQKSDQMGNFENSINRLSPNNEKYVPRKQESSTQSLDRFLKNKHKNKSNSVKETVTEVIYGLSKELHYSTPKVLPLRQYSTKHTHTPTANVVTQTFPITQRKLLQDPDSGEYFLVDMPVQVKTKTFFDPETNRYVQLPVQEDFYQEIHPYIEPAEEHTPEEEIDSVR